MKIDVSDLLKQVGAELKVDRSENLSFSDDDFSIDSPVNIKLKLVNAGGTVLVTGTLRMDVKMSCCRCLKQFDLPLKITVEEEYGRNVPHSRAGKKDEEIELKEKDFVFQIGEDNIIDLDEAIRQNVIVSLPIKPLCSKDCSIPGIQKADKKKVDPRLEKLKSFKALGGN